MMTIEQIQKGIKSLEWNIQSKQMEMQRIKESIISNLNDDVFDDYTMNLIESKVKKIRECIQEQNICKEKIRLSNQIINHEN